MIRILQHNQGHRPVALDLLHPRLRSSFVDLVCLQEPCSGSSKLVGYQYHGLRKNEEACVLSKRGIPCHTVFAFRDLVVVKGSNFGIASWYLHGTDMPRRELAFSELDQVLFTWPVSVPLYISSMLTLGT